MIPRSGRSPGGGHGNPLQYSCLENPMDRGAWRATFHRVARSRTRLKRIGTAQPSTACAGHFPPPSLPPFPAWYPCVCYVCVQLECFRAVFRSLVVLLFLLGHFVFPLLCVFHVTVVLCAWCFLVLRFHFREKERVCVSQFIVSDLFPDWISLLENCEWDGGGCLQGSFA